MLPQLLALTMALAPAFVSAALYPKDSLVKQIDTKTFRSAMKQNQTSVVAFVASWCGHCKRMAPEYSKAALGLYPLIPVYAVDCDENRALCAEQGVQGFPTVKLFPRGKEAAPIPFDGPDRTASAFYYFATRRVPSKNTKLYKHEQIAPWVTEHVDRDRVLLLSKSKGVPLLWKVLANKYRDDFAFANHRDRKGRTSVKMGYEPGAKAESKVLVYPAGATTPVLFEGILKLDTLSKFLDSVIDGTADLGAALAEARAEDYALSAEEREIERKQEAQRIALAHGGFTEMIDFEEAIKQYGADFHGTHGFGGALGGMPKKKDAGAAEEAGAEGGREEDPIHRILRVQKEKAEQKEREKGAMPKTGEAGQVVFDAPTDAEAPHTPTKTASVAQATPSAPADDADDEVEASAESHVVDGKVAAPQETAEPDVAAPVEAVVVQETVESAEHVKDEL